MMLRVAGRHHFISRRHIEKNTQQSNMDFIIRKSNLYLILANVLSVAGGLT